MSLELLGGSVSPFVRKVRVVLAEKGLDYEHEQVNPFAGPPGWRDISPLGRIPAFKDGDRIDQRLVGDRAYLEKTFPTPALYPSDPYDYARALWFEEFMDGGVVPARRAEGVLPAGAPAALLGRHRRRAPRPRRSRRRPSRRTPRRSSRISRRSSATATTSSATS